MSVSFLNHSNAQNKALSRVLTNLVYCVSWIVVDVERMEPEGAGDVLEGKEEVGSGALTRPREALLVVAEMEVEKVQVTFIQFTEMKSDSTYVLEELDCHPVGPGLDGTFDRNAA